MQLDPIVFRAYDIRGIRDTQITAEFMKNLGRAFAAVFAATEVVVGYDARPGSKEFMPHFVDGILEQGADVRLVGLVPSELVIVTAGLEKIQNAAIITASHNPAEYIGIKLYKDVSVQIAFDDGQADLQAMMEHDTYPEPSHKGTMREFNPWPGYIQHVVSVLNLPKLDERKVLVDAGNGTGGMIMEHIAELFALDMDKMYFEIDGTYPNHTPNPVIPLFRQEAEAQVSSGLYDFGILFDGDADRIIFLDEQGQAIPSDYAGTLLVDEVFQSQEPGSGAVTDLKRGWTLQTSAKKNGYEAHIVRTGNPFLKRHMRKHAIPFGFEGSAHMIYKDFFYSESSALTLGYILSLLQTKGKKLSELVAPYRQTIAMIDEINYEHSHAPDALRAIEDHFRDGALDHTDGLSVTYPDWHCNVRTSNTEPLLRLNVETRNALMLDEKYKEIEAIILASGGKKVDH